MTRITLHHLLIILGLLAYTPANADLYRWQDDQGLWHVTDDLAKVPKEYGPAVETFGERDLSGDSKINVVKSSNPTPDRRDLLGHPARTAPSSPPQKFYSIPYNKAHSSLIVEVTINDSLSIPLILDTGASYTTLSRGIAEKLGINVDGILPRTRVSTANGVITAYLVRLSSIQLGDARVEDITAIIPGNSELGTWGLLGLNFLNEFDWSNDTRNLRLTLKEFAPLPNEEAYGGQNKQWWQNKFTEIKNRIELETKALRGLEDYDENGPIERDHKDRYIEIQRANVVFFKKELALLDNKANRYMVPRSWR
jgi:clan AA aspartic protease (TIGR02281 family)